MVRRKANAANANSSLRRHHRKSRNGCKQCKQRHQKCDEHRPTCVNCSTAELQCSYLEQSLSPQTTAILERPSPSGSSIFSNISTPSSADGLDAVIRAAASSGYNSNAINSITDGPVTQTFDLSHLVLLHHLENDMLKTSDLSLLGNDSDRSTFTNMIFDSAVAAPYLMDEMLAFSALHLSTLQSDNAEIQKYHHQAQQLQTRALMHFNTARQSVSDDNCMPMFLFSSFLGMHLLFDAVTTNPSDFTECLDKFVQFINLYRGVRSVTHYSWPTISQTALKHIIAPIERIDQFESELPATGQGCDRLLNFLNASDNLGPKSLRACCSAVDSLKWTETRYKALPKPHATHIILAWPLLIHSEYTDLLKQRRPEALVILAHWAIFLHHERHFWLFGNAGRFLIESISKYLGTYWDPWMAWPKEVLDQI